MTPERLREVLEYRPDVGSFVWKVDKSQRVRAGHPAGYMGGRYREIVIDGVSYKEHRLAWLYVHKCWPEGEIDHINGDGADNRIVNLRDMSHAENMHNERKARKRSTTGVQGAFPTGKRLCAKITAGYKRHYLGTFDTAELARAVYLEAKKRLHPTAPILKELETK